MRSLRLLAWITQLGCSVAAPLVLCILGALWLRESMNVGGWIVPVGIFLGIGGAVSGLWSSLKTMQRQAGEDEKEEPPVSFNDHH